MGAVRIVSDNIISPLGNTTEENFHRLCSADSGIRLQRNHKMDAQPFYAALLPSSFWQHDSIDNQASSVYTRFESLLIQSIQAALLNTTIDIGTTDTVLIISSTKGNIELLENEPFNKELAERISLYSSAKKIAAFFKHPNTPVVISNACISGLVALLTAKRLIDSGQYKNAIVAGADLITRFVLSGFQSFQAISKHPCRPFDKDRDGINLGEAAGSIILSGCKGAASGIQLSGGASSNDANHISGPSRTGRELNIAIERALQMAGLSAKDMGFISAHGTATIYNDEMEAKAFSLSALEQVPVNSLKGFYGHTLGAAGIIESVIAIQSLKQNKMIPTLGFESSGVSKPINVCNSLQDMYASHCLKTASGFGGCNAALVFSKYH
jgi:3-oxoacyl-[acyl-carrier-protein] synthase-1